MGKAESQNLEPLARLVVGIDRHIDQALSCLSTLFYSTMSKNEADRIRTAVLAIHAGNSILRNVIGEDQVDAAADDAEAGTRADVSSSPEQQEQPGTKPKPKPAHRPMPEPMPGMEWISASRNLQRLVYEEGPQRASDVIAAGLATSPDEAMALMNELVQSHNATWINIADTQAIMAVR